MALERVSSAHSQLLPGLSSANKKEGFSKAAIITAAGKAPMYVDFNEPVAEEGQELITVSASALSQFSKSRSWVSHYSSSGKFPSVASADGVGRTATGTARLLRPAGSPSRSAGRKVASELAALRRGFQWCR